jgi:hypothetical protein
MTHPTYSSKSNNRYTPLYTLDKPPPVSKLSKSSLDKNTNNIAAVRDLGYSQPRNRSAGSGFSTPLSIPSTTGQFNLLTGANAPPQQSYHSRRQPSPPHIPPTSNYNSNKNNNNNNNNNNKSNKNNNNNNNNKSNNNSNNVASKVSSSNKSQRHPVELNLILDEDSHSNVSNQSATTRISNAGVDQSRKEGSSSDSDEFMRMKVRSNKEKAKDAKGEATAKKASLRMSVHLSLRPSSGECASSEDDEETAKEFQPKTLSKGVKKPSGTASSTSWCNINNNSTTANSSENGGGTRKMCSKAKREVMNLDSEDESGGKKKKLAMRYGDGMEEDESEAWTKKMLSIFQPDARKSTTTDLSQSDSKDESNVDFDEDLTKPTKKNRQNTNSSNNNSNNNCNNASKKNAASSSLNGSSTNAQNGKRSATFIELPPLPTVSKKSKGKQEGPFGIKTESPKKPSLPFETLRSPSAKKKEESNHIDLTLSQDKYANSHLCVLFFFLFVCVTIHLFVIFLFGCLFVCLYVCLSV